MPPTDKHPEGRTKRFKQGDLISSLNKIAAKSPKNRLSLHGNNRTDGEGPMLIDRLDLGRTPKESPVQLAWVDDIELAERRNHLFVKLTDLLLKGLSKSAKEIMLNEAKKRFGMPGAERNKDVAARLGVCPTRISQHLAAGQAIPKRLNRIIRGFDTWFTREEAALLLGISSFDD